MLIYFYYDFNTQKNQPQQALKGVFLTTCCEIMVEVSGVRCQGVEVLNTETSYETLRGRNSEPQNIEYRTAECRRMESLLAFVTFSAE
jgi:hypothetical protein